MSRVLSVVVAILLVAVTVQVALAGAGAFGAPAWTMHMMLGGLIAVLAIATLVIALIARPGRAIVVATVAILVLAGAQPVLAVLAQRSEPWFGLLHAAAALPMFTLAVWAVRAVPVGGTPAGRAAADAS